MRQRAGANQFPMQSAQDGATPKWRRRVDRRVRRVLRSALLALVVSALVTGCGRPAGVVFEPMEPPLFWPGAPAPPRIHYVGQLSGNEDLKPAVSFGQGLNEALFGKPEPIQMTSPYALCTDGASRLFVADNTGQVVHVFDLDTRSYEQWQPPTDNGGFAVPVGIAFDAAGKRVLVADSGVGLIWAFSAAGDYLGVLGEAALNRPCGLVVEPESGRIIVADAAAHQVVVLSFDGELAQRVGQRGPGSGQFNFPTNVALDSQGHLYVSDSLNSRVQVFDRDLKPLGQIGSRGDLPGYLSQPKGLALDTADHLYVVDAHFEAVQIFDLEGQFLLSFGREGTGPGEFWLPAGMHIDGNDRIWVADPYNRRVQVFDYRLQETAP